MIRIERERTAFAAALGLTAVLVLGALSVAASSSEPTYLETISWPRAYASDGDTVIVFDPQVDTWEKHEKLSARSAVAVKPKGSKESVYGVIEYVVTTEIDAEQKEVLFRDRKLNAIRFTGLEASQAAKSEEIARRTLKQAQNIIVPLEYLIAQVEADMRTQPSTPVNMDPPPIFSGEAPSILLMCLGAPDFKAITGTDLQFCVNTNWDLMLHPGTSQYYLLDGEGWLTAKSLKDGPWSAATSLPASLSSLPKDDNWTEVRKNVPGKKIPVPAVFYTERPAELIVLEGPAKYDDVPGTDLRYVTNTVSDLFQHEKDGNFYFLTSGRWFRAKSLQGPWTAATTDLPEDFGKIPADHAKGSVRASVPGTPEASDAVLLAQIPQKANVDPKTVHVTPTYDGDPEFVLIEGTKVYYVVNTPYSVFLCNGSYYCCQDAVWFCAPNVNGAWTVCTSIPQDIYGIPSSHPKYNVTYVHIYETSPTVVVVGYTAGYTGVYVSSGVVVYGVGYPVPYAPYYYYHYHPYYYGYGCAMHYSYAHGTYYRGASAYGPYGGAGYATAYNPHTGTYSRGAYAYGPYGERHAAQSYNPYTGTYKARAGGSTPYSSWEQGVVSNGSEWARGATYSDARGTVSGIQTSKGGAAVGVKTDDGSAAIGRSQSGDVYAAKDGNVYKKGDDGSWSSYENGQWSEPATRDQAAAQSQTKPSTTPTQTKSTATKTTAAPTGTKESAVPSQGASKSPGAAQSQSGNKSPGAAPAAASHSELDKQSASRSRGWDNAQRGTSARTGGGGRSR